MFQFTNRIAGNTLNTLPNITILSANDNAFRDDVNADNNNQQSSDNTRAIQNLLNLFMEQTQTQSQTQKYAPQQHLTYLPPFAVQPSPQSRNSFMPISLINIVSTPNGGHRMNRTKHSVSAPLFHPHKCDICFQSFTKRHQMLVHKRIHSAAKPHVCTICHKSYASKSTQVYHMRRTHPMVWQTINKK